MKTSSISEQPLVLRMSEIDILTVNETSPEKSAPYSVFLGFTTFHSPRSCEGYNSKISRRGRRLRMARLRVLSVFFLKITNRFAPCSISCRFPASARLLPESSTAFSSMQSLKPTKRYQPDFLGFQCTQTLLNFPRFQ